MKIISHKLLVYGGKSTTTEMTPALLEKQSGEACWVGAHSARMKAGLTLTGITVKLSAFCFTDG